MLYLLIKEKGNTFKLYSPDTYGVDTWGSNSQTSIVKKKKYWYINHWTAGNEWVDDEEYDSKLNVIKETADLDEIIRYVVAATNDRKIIENILIEAQNIYNTYIKFTLWTLQ